MKDLATKAFTSLKSGFVKAVLGALESFDLRFFRHFFELQFKEKHGKSNIMKLHRKTELQVFSTKSWESWALSRTALLHGKF